MSVRAGRLVEFCSQVLRVAILEQPSCVVLAQCLTMRCVQDGSRACGLSACLRLVGLVPRRLLQDGCCQEDLILHNMGLTTGLLTSGSRLPQSMRLSGREVMEGKRLFSFFLQVYLLYAELLASASHWLLNFKRRTRFVLAGWSPFLSY